MKKMKKNRGITLITLVVTIIVLLILAGVIINALSGENGILNQAAKTKLQSERAKISESIELYIKEINIEMNSNPNITDNNIIDIKDIPIKFKGSEPNIGWIYLENNVVTKYEFYYDEFYILKANETLIIEDFKFSELINVKDYGAIGDGETDDTIAIKSAINYLNDNGGTLYFPIGTYNVSVTQNDDSVIKLQSDKEINIDFFASTIVLQPNQYKAYNMININECTSANIRNGFLVGDRKEHDYTTVNSTHEFGYGLFFTQTLSGTAFNMDISEMTGDAIINKNGESGGTVTISECNLHHCRRQGISVLDSDIINISNTNIHHIGTFDNINGAAPSTGIDIEPASGTNAVNKVSLDNVKIFDTTSYGLINISDSVQMIEIFNSEINNLNGKNAKINNSILKYDSNNAFLLENVAFKDSTFLLYSSLGFYINNSTIDGCVFENVNSKKSVSLRIYSHTSVNNTTFKNMIGVPEQYSSNSNVYFGIVFKDSSYNNFKKGSSNNVYDNCSIYMEGITLGDENSKIKNSYIFVTNEVTLNNLEIVDCTTRSNSGTGILNLNNCNINNSGVFGGCKKYLNNTYLFIDSLYNGRFKDGSTCNNSTIHIKNNMEGYALNWLTFSNNSKVILDKYNNTNKIRNLYSTEGTDYIVEYNGTEPL